MRQKKRKVRGVTTRTVGGGKGRHSPAASPSPRETKSKSQSKKYRVVWDSAKGHLAMSRKVKASSHRVKPRKDGYVSPYANAPCSVQKEKALVGRRGRRRRPTSAPMHRRFVNIKVGKRQPRQEVDTPDKKAAMNDAESRKQEDEVARKFLSWHLHIEEQSGKNSHEKRQRRSLPRSESAPGFGVIGDNISGRERGHFHARDFRAHQRRADMLEHLQKSYSHLDKFRGHTVLRKLHPPGAFAPLGSHALQTSQLSLASTVLRASVVEKAAAVFLQRAIRGLLARRKLDRMKRKMRLGVAARALALPSAIDEKNGFTEHNVDLLRASSPQEYQRMQKRRFQTVIEHFSPRSQKKRENAIMLLQIHVRQWLARRMQKQAWKLAKGKKQAVKSRSVLDLDLIEVKKAIEAEALLPEGTGHREVLLREMIQKIKKAANDEESKEFESLMREVSKDGRNSKKRNLSRQVTEKPSVTGGRLCICRCASKA